MAKPGRFLTAEWRSLLMLNFEVAPALVQSYVPAGAELDFWNGKTYVSVVGFRFLRTKVLGLPIPFHRDFYEINLRFYVCRQAPEGRRRGVVFVKEIVPRWMVTCVARNVYNENYVTRRMRGETQLPEPDRQGRVSYEWKHRGRWNRLAAAIGGEPLLAGPASEEAFITEHYWGYARQRDGDTVEYEVEHPPWRVWQAADVEFDADAGAEYGGDFNEVLRGKPSSAFVAEGSAIVVRKGRKIAKG